MSEFTKFHALGNDFLIIDREAVAAEADIPDLARRICDRHTGVGADGLLVISVRDKARGAVDFRIFNADGSEAEISGNGLRCAAAFLYDQGKLDVPRIVFNTPAGERDCDLVEKKGAQVLIKVDFGVPRLNAKDIPFDDGRPHERIIDYPLMINRKKYPVTVVSVGNPHCAVFVERYPARFEWHQLGREIESHPFFPNRTNIEFIRIRSRSEIEVMFWERGVGETLSSGSGSTAAAVAAMLKGYVDRTVKVTTSMGQVLVDWTSDKVYQTGPAEFAFTGSFQFKQ